MSLGSISSGYVKKSKEEQDYNILAQKRAVLLQELKQINEFVVKLKIENARLRLSLEFISAESTVKGCRAIAHRVLAAKMEEGGE